jgi:hypothetical protein
LRSGKDSAHEEGLALFLVRQPDEKTNYYFTEYLPVKFLAYINLAAPLLRMRNIIIILTIVEIFSAILGFSYYFIRRVRYLFIPVYDLYCY